MGGANAGLVPAPHLLIQLCAKALEYRAKASRIGTHNALECGVDLPVVHRGRRRGWLGNGSKLPLSPLPKLQRLVAVHAGSIRHNACPWRQPAVILDRWATRVPVGESILALPSDAAMW